MKIKSNLVCMLGLGAAALGLASCGKSSSSSDTPTSFSSAVTKLKTSVSGLDTLLPNSSTALVTAIKPMTAVASPNVWSGTTWMSHPMCSGGASDKHCGGKTVHLKDWMGYQLDPSAVRDNGSSINIFGRINSALQIACAIMTAMTVDSATGYPTDGAQTITFTADKISSITSACGAEIGKDLTVGTSISATVSAVTPATYYDKKVVLILPSEMGGATQTFMFRFNASEVNIASGEASTTNVSRTIAAVNLSTGVTRVEYYSYSDSDSGGEFGRLFLDTPNDVGSITYSTHSLGAQSSKLIYTLRGKPSSPASAQVAFSARVTGFGYESTFPSNSFSTILKACVDQNTGNIATDDTVACTSVTGTATDDTGFVTMMNDLYSSNTFTLAKAWAADAQLGATATLPFTTADEVATKSANH